MTRDTIYALSSGAPPAGIAIVRISGPVAGATLQRLAGHLPQPRLARVVALHHPVDGSLLDRGLVLWFPGPGSATGEDVAELHLHGGKAVVQVVLQVLGELGLRMAEPGEFTRRSFENGRIDLSEAEGLGDLLQAETESQRRGALKMAIGGLSRVIGEWQKRLLGIAAQVEARIDYSDEDDVGRASGDPAEAIAALVTDMRRTLQTPPAERLRDGIRIVIAGPPNAGKSTLLNALAGRDAAITSPVAGTTRDVVEVPVILRGTPVIFLDTAGLREAGDDIEAIGVARAGQAIEAAHIVLWLGEAGAGDPKRLHIHAKADLYEQANGGLHVSALTGAGMGDLVAKIVSRAAALLPEPGALTLNARQQGIVAEVANALESAQHVEDDLIIAETLREALAGLHRLTGRADTEAVLDALFANFCIGK